MEHNKMERRDDIRRMERPQYQSTAAATAWKIVGGTALALVAVTVIAALPDIKRYIKINTM
ncbi:MAG: hypothetical protein H7Z37_00795 [Pyrinomonadaceae bacterium]|nr:hypothetical protein [Pyrinomonadaceae bacterium]